LFKRKFSAAVKDKGPTDPVRGANAAPTLIPEPAPVNDQRRVRPVPTRGRRNVLARLRIRKKLIVLHTAFSLGLAAILLVTLKPSLDEIVERSEVNEGKALLEAILPNLELNGIEGPVEIRPGVTMRAGTAAGLGLGTESASQASAVPGTAIEGVRGEGETVAVTFVPRGSGDPVFVTLSVRIDEARAAVWRLYAVLTVALLVVYALVAISLETLVLPSTVYAPIRRLLEADLAVQEGRPSEELIGEEDIPEDELGEIMRSRNGAVVKLREQEAALSRVVSRLAEVADDLRKKNHLLETAKRNLADADRLASLGMMSAGIAHELNTPLAVLKGLTEKLEAADGTIDPASAALMVRVVRRLERLGESLLDFARVRPPLSVPTDLRELVNEAITLVRLDREHAATLENHIAEPLLVSCDADRMVQVFVNLLRNAADAAGGRGSGLNDGRALVTVNGLVAERDGHRLAVIAIADNGKGIDADVLPRLFEPFFSTRLDARGTGLGLAVAEGIVREHGGLIAAGNRPDARGAVFEVILPMDVPSSGVPSALKEEKA